MAYKNKLPKSPFLIIWIDAMSSDEWQDLEKATKEECPYIYTCGFILHQNKNRIAVALNVDPSGEAASCIMYIPKGMIKHILPLDKGQKIKI